ncbi:MAG TPA: hypothetical protein VGO91_01440, partial [Pyrinomonadaceae bacterium]|nr:hypothetical protein [Pyrinomonadaceae bacterium]
ISTISVNCVNGSVHNIRRTLLTRYLFAFSHSPRSPVVAASHPSPLQFTVCGKRLAASRPVEDWRLLLRPVEIVDTKRILSGRLGPSLFANSKFASHLKAYQRKVLKYAENV